MQWRSCTENANEGDGCRKVMLGTALVAVDTNVSKRDGRRSVSSGERNGGRRRKTELSEIVVGGDSFETAMAATDAYRYSSNEFVFMEICRRRPSERCRVIRSGWMREDGRQRKQVVLKGLRVVADISQTAVAEVSSDTCVRKHVACDGCWACHGPCNIPCKATQNVLCNLSESFSILSSVLWTGVVRYNKPRADVL